MAMKTLQLIAFAMVIAAIGATQSYGQGTTAPLPLFINGGGSVSPLTNGEVLEVGQTYNMVATPDPGYAFDSWWPVNVFTLTSLIVDINGNTNTNVSVIVSPVPVYTNGPSLDFVMQPMILVYNQNGNSLTRSQGWWANFVPILLNIQSTDSGVVLTWTNLSFTLQTAATPGGDYTNIVGAVSPYTNSSSAPAQFFRLKSN